MNLYTRIGMFFFIVGALLTLLGSVFKDSVDPFFGKFIYVILLFTGVFAGLLNVSEDEEHHFLLAGVSMLIVLTAFSVIFATSPVMATFIGFLEYSFAFVGSMTLIIAVKTVLEFGSQNYRVSPTEDMNERSEDIDEWEMKPAMRAWHFIIFFAVALTFFLILVELFFDPPQVVGALMGFLNWVIILVFIIDLFVLFRQEGSAGRFLNNCWLDIIAAIPFWGVFQALKAVRLVRMAKVGKSLKFFGHSAKKNVYIRKAHRRKDRLHVKEHPISEQKMSHKH